MNDDPRRAAPALNHRLILTLLALAGILAYLLPVVVFLRSMLTDAVTLDLVNRDFANYWMGARLALAGDVMDLFHQPVYFAHLQAEFGQDYPLHAWSYPPHVLLLLWPLGLVGYLPALLAWQGATMAFFLYAADRFRKRYAPDAPGSTLLLVVLSFSMMAFDAAQNGFLNAGLLLLAFAGYRRQLVVPALALALLTTKPQLGILVPLLLLFDRQWRLVGATALFSALFVGASLLVFGAEAWTAYLDETLAYQRFVMTHWFGIFLPMMPTVFGAVRTLGQPANSAFVASALVSVVSLAAVLWLLVRANDPLLRIYTVLCGTFLVSPYAFNYDMGALAVVAALACTRVSAPYPALSLAVVATLPALVLNLGRFGLPIAPLLLALSLLGVASLVWRQAPGTAITDPSGGPRE